MKFLNNILFCFASSDIHKKCALKFHLMKTKEALNFLTKCSTFEWLAVSISTVGLHIN